MFQFPTFASCIAWWQVLHLPGCPIRIPADRFVFADPRSFSQLIASFFAFQSLGIPHVPLFTFFSHLRFYLLQSKPGLINTSSLLFLDSCSFYFYTMSKTVFLFGKECVWIRIRTVQPIINWKFIIIHYEFLIAFCAAVRLFKLCCQYVFYFAVRLPLFLFPVENNGFEPLTLCVQGRCSSQLS